jgi:hypothetical protein
MKYIYLIFSLLTFNLISAQSDCPNLVEIKQLGVEFCLPDIEWTIESEDGLRFISIYKSTFYFGTDTFTLRVEKLPQNTSVSKYFDQELNYLNKTPGYKEEIISKGKKNINGKEFLYCKNKGVSNGHNSYSITYFYCENKIGYALSYVLSDETKAKWNEAEALKIWNSFKIISLPEDSVWD